MMIKESSAGAIIFRPVNGERLYLLLHYTTGHWDFPKGNIEKGETEEQAAVREIHEETGIVGLKFIPGFRKRIRYFYRRDGQPVNKDVVYFLAETQTAEVKISWEHAGFEWLPFDRAVEKISFGNSKSVLKEAENVLSGAEGLGKFFK